MVGVSREQRMQTVCLMVLTAIALGAALYFLARVLVPFILAIFFTYCLIPVIDLLMRKFRWPRWAALVVSGGLGCVVLVGIGTIVALTVQQMAVQSGTYQKGLVDLQDRAVSALPLAKLGLSPQRAAEVKADLNKLLDQIPRNAAAGLLNETAKSIMAIVSNGLLVAIFVLFILLGSRSPVDLGVTWRRIEDSIKRYIVLKVVISAVTGTTQGLILYLLGVEFYMVFGLMGFLLNFIPNIGPVIATILPLPIVALHPDATVINVVLAIGLPGVIHFVSGNVVEPRIMGDSLDLHPIAIVLSLIFFGMIWGIVGMFIATPITGVVKILLEKIEFTRPIGDLLAGRIDKVTTRLDREDLFCDATDEQAEEEGDGEQVG